MFDMKTEDIAYMVLRFVCVFVVIMGINKTPEVVYSVYYNKVSIEQVGIVNFIMILLPPIVLFAFAIFCWVLTPKLSRSFVKESKPANTCFSLFDFQKVMFSVMGVYVISVSLPDLVNTMMMYLDIVRDSAEGKVPIVQGILVLLVQLITGLVLLFGADSLTTFLNRNQSGRNHDCGKSKGIIPKKREQTPE